MYFFLLYISSIEPGTYKYRFFCPPNIYKNGATALVWIRVNINQLLITVAIKRISRSAHQYVVPHKSEPQLSPTGARRESCCCLASLCNGHVITRNRNCSAACAHALIQLSRACARALARALRHRPRRYIYLRFARAFSHRLCVSLSLSLCLARASRPASNGERTNEHGARARLALNLLNPVLFAE